MVGVSNKKNGQQIFVSSDFIIDEYLKHKNQKGKKKKKVMEWLAFLSENLGHTIYVSIDSMP